MSTSPHGVDPTRLTRIEDKLDELTELVISMARAEEKISTLAKSNEHILEKLLKMDDRVSATEIAMAIYTRAHANLSKVFWSVLTSSLTALVIWFVSKHFFVAPN